MAQLVGVMNRGVSELNGLTLKTRVYDHQAQQWNISELNLNHCITFEYRGSNYELAAIGVGDQLRGMDSSWEKKHHNLSSTNAKGNLILHLRDSGSTIHARLTKSGSYSDDVYDMDFNIEKHLRVTSDGAIEFVHPKGLNRESVGKTLDKLSEFIAPVAGAVGLQGSYAEASKSLIDAITGRDDIVPDAKAFLQGCYFDQGHLVRRGTKQPEDPERDRSNRERIAKERADEKRRAIAQAEALFA